MTVKNRFLAIIMAIVMIVTSVNFMVFTSTAATTITVASAADLANLNSNVSAATAPVTINFTADIDASGISFQSVNTSKRVLVHGNNHYIKNLKVSTNGLFTKVGASSSITNLGLIDIFVTNFSATSGTTTGYGLLCGYAGNNTTITGCFAHGTLAVYGSGQNIGGLVGWFNGTMNNCFTVADIHTDGSRVGGLIGYYASETNVNKVSISYSTGNIDNEGREYIGGLVGYSECSCLHQCYTSTYIKNPYVDTVKAIGFVPELDEDVFYDETISFQRQGDMDGVHRFGNSYYNCFPSADLWVYSDTYYPQIEYFYNNSNTVFKNISAISAAVVQLDSQFGREYVPLSTSSAYSTATLTSKTSSGNNKIDWKITGGVDEYIYDSSVDGTRNYGPIEEGLSGNIYDVKTGTYIFTTETDVVFTATSGNFERDITVHVSKGTLPYQFSGGGAGTSGSPFIIKTPADLDLVRMYCVDDLTGGYYYRVENDIDLSTDDTTKNWTPIMGFKGNLTTKLNSSGTGKNILNLTVSEPNFTPEGDLYSGLFGTISNTAVIDKLYIPDADIITNSGDYSGILAGYSNILNITNCVVSGMVSGSNTSGQLVGKANNSDFTGIIAIGLVSAFDNAGGLVGHAADSNVVVTDCLTASSVIDAVDCGGIIGYSDGAIINTSLSNSILLTSVENFKHGICGGSATINNSFFYENQAGVFDDPNGRDITEITSSSMLTALNANGRWAQSNTKVTPYPNVTKKSQLNYFVTNPLAFTATSGNGTVENFTTAKINQGGYLTGESFDGYSVSGGTDNNYTFALNSSGYLQTFTTNNGGREIFKIIYKSTSASVNDVRYIIFDVKTVSVNYRVFLDNQDNNDYLDDMTETLLADFVDSETTKYGFILDTGADDIGIEKSLPVKLVCFQDSIGVDLCIPNNKYGYTVQAYSDSGRTKPLSVVSTGNGEYNLYGIADPESGRYSVYLDITISEKDLPWGIYNID